MPKIVDPSSRTPQQEKQHRANERKRENRVQRELDAFYAADRPGGLTAFRSSPEYQRVYGPRKQMSDA